MPVIQSPQSLRNLLAPASLLGGGSTARLTLQRILTLRLLVAVSSMAGLLIFRSYFDVAVQLAPVLVIFSLILVTVALGFYRLTLPRPISNFELFSHLLVDLLFLVLVLVAVGGSNNPLISYLLVLLAVGATFLSRRFTQAFAASSILIYSFFVVKDLRDQHMDQAMMDFQLHVVGMWVIFVVSAVLISVFVSRMASAIREREVSLAESRENEIRNEQLVAIGTLAAGTAHALGTPLSTMAVLLTELDKLSSEELQKQDIKEDISILRRQVVRCRESLNQLTHFYNKEFIRAETSERLVELVNSIRDYITNIHPTAPVSFRLEDEDAEVAVVSDPNLKHAIINLIENSIKAASSQVDVTFQVRRQDEPGLELSIGDNGPGIPTKVLESMGEPFNSTRRDSMGLGIYLANAAIQKYGGNIEMFNRKSGGAMTVVRLPLSTALPVEGGPA